MRSVRKIKKKIERSYFASPIMMLNILEVYRHKIANSNMSCGLHFIPLYAYKFVDLQTQNETRLEHIQAHLKGDKAHIANRNCPQQCIWFALMMSVY